MAIKNSPKTQENSHTSVLELHDPRHSSSSVENSSKTPTNTVAQPEKAPLVHSSKENSTHSSSNHSSQGKLVAKTKNSTEKPPTRSNDSRLARLKKLPDTMPTKSQQAKFSALEKIIIAEFHDVISDVLTPSHRIKGPPVDIIFKKGVDVRPIHINIARPLPLNFKPIAEKTLAKYISEGILKPVDHATEWLSPGFWTPKANGQDLRLVTDFSHINQFLLRDVTPFASASDCLMQIPSGTTHFGQSLRH
jgi:hypothetical protein